MNNNHDSQQEDIIWPPAPSMLPPKVPEPRPLLLRIPLWQVVLIDIGGCIFLSGAAYLRFSIEHRAIHWAEIAAEGFIPGIGIFVMHLWLRRVLFARLRSKGTLFTRD